MTLPSPATDRLLAIHLALAQYPILSARIRELMRFRLHQDGFLSFADIYEEARRAAIQSQVREGIHNPLFEEASDIWDRRLATVLEQLTDLHFVSHYEATDLDDLIETALTERGATLHTGEMSFNPETAPLDLVFSHGMRIENSNPQPGSREAARLEEVKVVLIRNMISDQLRYINIAKEWFTVADLAEIRRHKLGQGRIGGKAAGMLLAARILKSAGSPELQAALKTPESFYVGSDLFYNFISVNNLLRWNDQKYKSEAQQRAEYPTLVAEFRAGVFTPSASQYLETILTMAGGKPLIVRSSSLLEDNFGTAFAGKYESVFLPNQSTPQINLHAMERAMAEIYASTLNPAAMLYRKSRGLIDYDERMALLIQVVEGDTVGDYYYPMLAGVGFSHNAYRWSPQIRAEDGFIRLVWGLGTRAVDRVGNDYPRLVALSHPKLNPSGNTKRIRHYSQQLIDLINLKENKFETLPAHSVLNTDTPGLRYIAQLENEGYLRSLRTILLDGSPSDLVLTFDGALSQTRFPQLMQEMLQILERVYEAPVDMEFTAQLDDSGRDPNPQVTLIQCRPQAMLQSRSAHMPIGIPVKDTLFTGSSYVSSGLIEKIRYVLYVVAEHYFAIDSSIERAKLERSIGRLNAAMGRHKFIAIGPGRWGTSSPDLGVKVDYADIYNAKALIEAFGEGVVATEPSLGTHFFQDLLEGQIYPLAINIEEEIFQREWLRKAPNRLTNWVPEAHGHLDALRLVDVEDLRPGHRLNLAMDEVSGKAIAWLVKA